MQASLRYKITASYYAAFIILGFTVPIIGPSLPMLAAQTGSTLSAASFLFIARSTGAMLGSLASGRLYDRLPGHQILAAILVLAGIGLVLSPVASALWVLAITLFCIGIADGTMNVGCNTMILWVHGKKSGPFMNGLHFSFSLGAFILPLIITQSMLWTKDIKAAYILFGILAFAAAFWVSRTPSPDILVNKPNNNSDKRTDNILIGLTIILMFLYVAAEAGFGGWVFTYAQSLHFGNEITANRFTSLFFMTFMIGQLAAIPLTARVKPRTILLADIIGCIASITLILALPNSQTALWIGTAGFGFALSTAMPITLVMTGERVRVSGTVTGLYIATGAFGAMSLPWIIGQLYETVGPKIMPLSILVCCIFTLLFYGIYMLKDKTA